MNRHVTITMVRRSGGGWLPAVAEKGRIFSAPAFCFLMACCFSVTSGLAQPSRGPYGPLPQRYEIPAQAVHIYYVAPDGKSDAAGTSLAQPTTLEAAISRVVTGDAIILRGGIYRTGGLKLNQGILMQPYADEHPVLKGTQLANKWIALGHSLWRTSWPRLFPSKPADWWERDREGMRTPLCRFHNDMVFVDGELLQTVGWEGEVGARTFSIDYESGHVFIGIDPAKHQVEITAFDSAIVRTTGPCHGKSSDGKGPVIRGITFTQYAYRALEIEGKEPEGLADPATFGKEVVGTTLEDVTITFSSGVAGYFRGDRLTLRRCLISDTSTEGVYVIGSADCLLEKNIFARNNIEEITGCYPAAVKIFNQSYRVTCRDNLVMDNPHSNGIWYDVGNVDGVFIHNWVEDAIIGFFFEISKGAICAGNVFVRCHNGILILNSSHARVYHNTFVNSIAAFERNERSAVGDHFGWHPSTGPDVDKREGHIFCGNLMAGDQKFQGPLLQVRQSKVLCGKLNRPQFIELDDNAFVRSGGPGAPPLIAWSPAESETCETEFQELDQFKKVYGAYEPHGQMVETNPGSVFLSPALANYELRKGAVQPIARPLPVDLRLLPGWGDLKSRLPGAFPVAP